MHESTTAGWAAAGLLVGLVAVGVTTAAGAQTFDPKVTENVGVVELITIDDDGDERKSKVWIVLINDEAYLRTNESRWLANLERSPVATLRVEGTDYPVRGEVLSDPSWVEKVDEASREKYGWQERTIHIFRMSEPTIIRLMPTG